MKHPTSLPTTRALAAFCLAGLVADAARADHTLPAVQVEQSRSVADSNQLPNTTESITAAQAADTINASTTEDLVKYLPGVLVRRRFAGDTQAPMSSRTTGINAGARTLIIADGIWLSTYVNNNNQNGSPQWFMVAPEEVERIDVMAGPYAAMYPGNSYGSVTEITTRMPTRFEAGAKISSSLQDFSQYGTSDRYPSTATSAWLGSRSGPLSWRLSVNHLNSISQPVTYGTVAASGTAAGAGLPVVSGAFADRSRTGAPILVVGAGNLTQTVQDSGKLRMALDLSRTLQASWTFGYWQNSATASAQSYLSSGGAPFYGGTASNINGAQYAGPGAAGSIASQFSSSRTEQQHWMQALGLKSRKAGPWEWETLFSWFDFSRDLSRLSTGVYPAAQSGGAGRITDASGTRWMTWDAKARWSAPRREHALSFGVHLDQYTLASPTYDTSDWLSGGKGALFSDSRGKTRTQALWLQDVWRFAPKLSATLGARYERWQAYDGFNFATAGGVAFPVTQPGVQHSGLSPKLSLSWAPDSRWNLSASLGRALRFPTVGELYQNVQTGASFTQANPNLKPERVDAAELAIERSLRDGGRLRVSLFEEFVADALIAQTSTLPGFATPVSFTQNVDRTRQRGIEVVAQKDNVLLHGLELSGSLTWVDAVILGNSSYVPAVAGASSVGKRTPYVPQWRATAVATWRPNDKWSWTLAGRYSSRLWATVDNTDINPATYQGFESYFVLDARMRYRFDRHWSAAAGIDNLNNRKYFLFHPFPQRTLFAQLKYDY